MTITARTNAAAVRRLERRGAAAAVAFAIALGMSGGAFAQCVGSYHSSSGAGSTGSAATSGSVHSATSSTHSASTGSSCASGSGAHSAANLASLHSTGLGQGAGHAWSHRTAYRTAGIGNGGNSKKGVKSSVKP